VIELDVAAWVVGGPFVVVNNAGLTNRLYQSGFQTRREALETKQIFEIATRDNHNLAELVSNDGDCEGPRRQGRVRD